ncbi:MAG: hypothetical protein WA810_02365 [Maribacter sp.]
MKVLIFKLQAISMALLLLLSTISWTVGMHICQGKVTDIAFFSQAADCCMESGVTTIPNDKECCGDEIRTLAGQNELHFNGIDFDFLPSVFLTIDRISVVHPFHALSKKEGNPSSYPRPLQVRDLNILHQVFLI